MTRAGGRAVGANIIMSAAIARCPIHSFEAAHHNRDGLCKCTGPDRKDSQTMEEITMAKTGCAVRLVGEDGNAFAILGRCRRALRDYEGDSEAAWNAFYAEATMGDYDHLLRVTMRWFDAI